MLLVKTDRDRSGETMTQRIRKLIGTTLFVGFSLTYFFFVISVALARLPGTPLGLHLLFYVAVTGLWVLVCAFIIRWMLKPA
jgi:Mn2+/Fe2+ NRAMP family transporter